jgi:hypothetical protein
MDRPLGRLGFPAWILCGVLLVAGVFVSGLGLLIVFAALLGLALYFRGPGWPEELGLLGGIGIGLAAVGVIQALDDHDRWLAWWLPGVALMLAAALMFSRARRRLAEAERSWLPRDRP